MPRAGAGVGTVARRALTGRRAPRRHRPLRHPAVAVERHLHQYSGLASQPESRALDYREAELPPRKTIALIAHDNRKASLTAWCARHREALAAHRLYATGTTGTLVSAETGLTIEKLVSGPLGGDQQVGALIAEGKVNLLIFFWDPFEPMPHDPDVKALLRIAAVWNIPVACNESSADFIVASPLFAGRSQRMVPDYERYTATRMAR